MLGRSRLAGCRVPATTIAWLAISFAAAGANSFAAAVSDDQSARDLQRIVAWFEGEFDNREQLWFEADQRSKVPEAVRHERVHATHRPVDLPEFGRHVFYVEEYLDDDPQKVFRQRLVTFESARHDGVRMKLWFLKDAAAVRGADRDPARLAKLTRADVTDLPGCDVYWLPQGDQYVGGMRAKACVFGEGSDRRYSQHDLILAAESYWRLDRIFAVDTDKLLMGNPAGVPHKLDRAKRFACDVRFYGTDNYLDGPHPDDEEYLALPIHSQGGNLHVTRQKSSKAYTFRLNDKKYPYFEKRSDFMFLSVREAGKPFIAYSLHDRAAAYIGLHLGWMSVACERTNPPQLQPFTEGGVQWLN